MKKGIDVSYANGSINWSEAKKDVDFAIIRSSFGSDLPSQTDSFFFQNATGCVKNGIPFGLYHFAYFINEKTARDEADFAIKKANEFKEYVRFIALDIEEDSERYAKAVGGNPDWTVCAAAFLERVKAAGYVPVIYTNQSWITTKFNWTKLSGYKLWYAAPGADAPKYTCAVWQYSWKGRIGGITGDVDLDYLYDETLLGNQSTTESGSINDRDAFLNCARGYLGKNGSYVCCQKLKLGFVVDWCAYAVSAIMQDCGFVGKYIKAIEGGAGTIPRYSDGKYGVWFQKGIKAPKSGDLFFLRYADYPAQDQYFCDHVGIVEYVDGNTLTTLEGNVDGVSGNWAATSRFERKTRYLSDASVYAFYRPAWVENKKTSNHQNEEEPIGVTKDDHFKALVTASDGLNIRKGPGLAYQKLGAVPYGKTLAVQKTYFGNDYVWGLTNYGGISGWVALNFTRVYGKEITRGCRVKVKKGAKVYGSNESLSSFVYQTTFDVIEVSGNRIVIGIGNSVTAAVHRMDLTVVS